MTDQEFLTAMALMVSHWPHWEPSPETFAAGRRLLADLEWPQVVAAVDQLAVEQPNRGHCPGIGAVRAKCLDMFDPDPAPDAASAWLEVTAQMRACGHVHPPKFSHRMILETIKALGGWAQLCSSTNSELDRAHFLRLYTTLTDRLRSIRLQPRSVRELVSNRRHAAELTAGDDE